MTATPAGSIAEGNARLTDENGAVLQRRPVRTDGRFQERLHRFAAGWSRPRSSNGRRVTTRFSAPRAERAEGETTTFERGTYTACEPCKDHPEKPPLWQVKAAKIIHNNSEQTIYYEDATMEIFGIPVAYLPYFWTPDPTVKRKTRLSVAPLRDLELARHRRLDPVLLGDRAELRPDAQPRPS